MPMMQKNLRFTDRQLKLFARLVESDTRWPEKWSSGDRVAWILECWAKEEAPRFPQVDRPLR